MNINPDLSLFSFTLCTFLYCISYWFSVCVKHTLLCFKDSVCVCVGGWGGGQWAPLADPMVINLSPCQGNG